MSSNIPLIAEKQMRKPEGEVVYPTGVQPQEFPLVIPNDQAQYFVLKVIDR